MNSRSIACLIALLGSLSLYFIAQSSAAQQADLWWKAGFLWALLYGVNLYYVKKHDAESHSKLLLIAALLTHLIAWSAGPILEDDFYRYAWDGHNSRLGIHPYAQAPFDQVTSLQGHGSELWDSYNHLTLEQLKETHPELVPNSYPNQYPIYVDKINYPMYRTIYPPVVEGLFFSELLAPNTPWGFSRLILICDFLLIFLLWRYCKANHFLFCALALNPLFIKEGLNSWHFDYFLVPLLVILSLLKIQTTKAPNLQAILIGLSAGIRPWFAALILWEYPHWRWKQYTLFALTLGLPWLALFLLPGMPTNALSSWGEFAQNWEFNALFFELLRSVLSGFLGENQLRFLAWILAFLTLGLIALYSIKTKVTWTGPFAIVMWIFFLPAVNTWYIMPIACALLASQNPKAQGIGLGLTISMPLAYRHYNHLEFGAFLGIEWSFAQIGSIILIALLWIILGTKKAVRIN